MCLLNCNLERDFFLQKDERASSASYAKCWGLSNAEVATAVSWVLYSPISSSSVMGLTCSIHRLQIFERRDIQVTAVYPGKFEIDRGYI